MQSDAEKEEESAWRDLYLAALFEADLAKLPKRISEAEHALSLRDRELWYSGGDHGSEKRALVGAMRALEALRNIHQCPRQDSPIRSQAARVSSGVSWPSG
jgi:hypothetical protein